MSLMLDLRDSHLIENTKAFMELRALGIYTDDELQELYDRQVAADKAKDDAHE